jgi:hypothetical protein
LTKKRKERKTEKKKHNQSKKQTEKQKKGQTNRQTDSRREGTSTTSGPAGMTGKHYRQT